MKRSALVAALLLGLAPLTAQGQDMPGQRIMQRIDANHDGAISKDEMTAARERLFKKLDRNGDGAIDQQEIEGARDAIMDRADAAQARLGNRWRRLDTNGDGKVSDQEFARSMPLFDLGDRNGDGKLSADEIASVRKLIVERGN
ncbi:EF-hand domain-containing protein [Mesorhizobium sp. ES1-1]|uniref:EF-hand domain-containing protein n=1 Tax=Mesorhizobium sp. ES1-1 TaxID=2876629 RepID=UPI001CC9A636|nr:EF-hand domain-containing protein [Mesorhizobium sp. ES1-1]MBZ9678719.1 EF-hand domain-containing protein [Mesorhizobium sp. ES1-1]